MIVEPEVLVAFEKTWRSIVMPAGHWDHDLVMRELYDYGMLLDNVPLVYDHVTRGAVSKPNTIAADVIAMADEAAGEWERIVVQEETEELRDQIRFLEGEVRAYKVTLDALDDPVRAAILLGPSPTAGDFIEVERPGLAEEVDALRSALERTVRNFRLLLGGGPVRDVDEMFGEVERALGKS